MTEATPAAPQAREDPLPVDPEGGGNGSVRTLRRITAEAAARLDWAAEDLLEATLRHGLFGKAAVVSSFGAEAAVLLHMVGELKPDTPVLFLDTGKHFGETLRYRDSLVEALGLSDVRSISPDPEVLTREDADGLLFARDADRCCHLRKVLPLEQALAPFDAWVTGRKRHQGTTRSALPTVEFDGRHSKVNPLAHWTVEAVERYLARHDLPRHPLAAEGYRSIGCMTCTARTTPAQDARAGRWPGSAKTECGIHARPLTASDPSP